MDRICDPFCPLETFVGRSPLLSKERSSFLFFSDSGCYLSLTEANMEDKISVPVTRGFHHTKHRLSNLSRLVSIESARLPGAEFHCPARVSVHMPSV